MFRIRKGEGSLVTLMLSIMFLATAGGALGSPSVESLFFSRFGVEFLPAMYVALGFVTFVSALVITAALARLDRARLYSGLIILLAIAIGLSWYLVGFDLRWFYPVLWLMMYLFWTLVALMTWGLASMVCDTRQAKRLFPIFGAGAILGNAFGGLITRPLVSMVGTVNLLLIWAASLAITYFLVRLLLRGRQPARAPASPGANAREDLLRGYRVVRRSPLMTWLSVSAAMMAILLFSLAFPFYRGAAATFPIEDELTAFIGVFQGLVTVVAFLVSIFVANRFFARFGFMTAILVMPIIYFLGFTWVALVPVFTTLIIFRFFQHSWFQGISNTANQAVLNIVPQDRREQTRTFIDGVPRQIGIILVGLLLAFGQRFFSQQQMYLVAGAIALITVYVVYRARKAYAGALADALRAGRPQIFIGEEQSIGGTTRDKEALNAAIEGLTAKDSATKRVSAEILSELSSPSATDALVLALEDKDPDVRAAALRGIANAGAQSALLDVASRLRDPNPEVRVQAVDTLRALAYYQSGLVDAVTPLLGDEDASVSAHAALTLLRAHPSKEAIAILKTMAESHDVEVRATAVKACGMWGDVEGFDIAITGLKDPEPRVRMAAAQSMRQHGDLGIEHLMPILEDQYHTVREAAVETLQTLGASAVHPLAEALDNPARRQAALNALDKLEIEEIKPILDRFTDEQSKKALYYDRTVKDLPDRNSNERLQLLRAALKLESTQSAKMALHAAALLGDRRTLLIALDNLESSDRTQIANALESFESLAYSESVRPLLVLWEGIPIQGKRDEETRPNSASSTETLLKLLQDSNAWIRACAANVLRSEGDTSLEEVVFQLSKHDPDLFVRETAAGHAMEEKKNMETLATLSVMDRILFLRKVPLFKGLPPGDLKKVAGVGSEVFYSEDEQIVHQGDHGEEMYIIVSGEVSVRVSENGNMRELARRGPGEYVGEMAIITHEPRMASLVAQSDVRALCIGRKQFTGILRERPETSLAIIQVLCARLQERDLSHEVEA